MRTHKDKSGPLSGVFGQLMAVPYSFLTGFVIGLVLPVAAIGAVVAGIRLVTGMVPFLGEVSMDEEGGRTLSLRLVPPEQVGDLYAGHKEQIGGDLGKMKAEIEAILQEAQSRQAGPEEA
ncbi:MAG: hypothetical protein JSV81_01780 [Anaerolineales bacterium]|nr:MAG: hypothetical protein JSV81_01780 [Anaerolineales bacterium]